MDGLDEIGKDLKSKLSQIQTFANNAFAGRSQEAQDKLKGQHLDLNKAIRAAQKGDLKELTRLANKYDANTN